MNTNYGGDGMDKYEDIINLPHKQSSRRPQMSRIDRAAQFAPFAALTGYDDAIKETGRLTDDEVDLSEETLNQLNLKFRVLLEMVDKDVEVAITYFVPDQSKSGGTYVTARGCIKKFDEYERLITMSDRIKIPMDKVLSIESDIFNSEELI